jgi:hypothetical protein
MKIEVFADKPLGKYYLQNLKDEIITFTNHKSFDVPPGWYNFILEYTGEHIDLSDIKVNGQTLRHYFYTGFFTEAKTGKRFQPANAVWTEGYYSIWLHTEFGMLEIFMQQNIRNSDFGEDKFLTYLHTVDKPIEIDAIWPERIKSYYRAGHGPGWWRKGTLAEPYDIVAPEKVANIDRQKIIQDMPLDCKLVIDKDISEFGKQDGNTRILHRKVMREHAWLPFIELDQLKNKELAKLCEQIGYTRLLDVNLQTLPAGASFRPHIDDHYYQDPNKIKDAMYYTKGPVIFLLNLQEKEADKNQYKLGPAGLVPINDGAFFNQQYFSHCSINDSNYDRPMLILAGDRDIHYNY